VLVTIVLLVAAWSRSAAIVVGAWCVAAQLLYPALRALRRLVNDPQLQSARGQALGAASPRRSAWPRWPPCPCRSRPVPRA